MKKRLLSLLLLCCMVLTWLPVTASAASESATAKGGDATFTLRAESSSCADGHTGEIVGISGLTVDISKWKAEQKITVKYSVYFRCTDPDCELYSADDAFQHDGEHTFTNVDAELCHKMFTGSFTDTFNAAYGTAGSDSKKFFVSLTLTSDKGISEIVRHDYDAASACTEWYYSTRCWECKGCGDFFTREDCSDEYKTGKDMLYFPPVGHDLKNVPAKGPTCVDKGTVEHWACERCGRNFSDEKGENELKTIETDVPFAPHTYDTDGNCAVCSAKAAAGVKAADAAATTWYDTMAAALSKLTAGAQLTVNKDYDAAIRLDKTCTVVVKTGATVSKIETADGGDFAVTVINNGTVNDLTGYTGKVLLKSGSGSYGHVTNHNGSVGDFLYRESATKFCYYRTTAGQWLRPEQTTESSIQNVTVAYAPVATLTITGDNITGESGSYALTADKDDTLTLTAAVFDLDGESTTASYRWYYENDPETSLSTDATLTLERVGAGKRTVICTATVEGYSVSASLELTVLGEKASQSMTLKLAQDTVGIREKVLPILSVEGVQEEAAVTYYQMLGETPAPAADTEIGADFSFTETGEYKIYAYTAETDNYAATASAPVTITVTPHANHCICGGTFNHTHKNVEWQAWDGKSEIAYEGEWIPISATGSLWYKVAYVYLTGDVTANLTVSGRTILHLCLNGYSFTSADPSKPAITVAGTEKAYVAKLDLCDCAGTGTLGGASVSGGSVHATWAEINLYGGTLTGNNATGNGGAVYLSNSSFTMHGGAITNNTASNGGGIYAGSSGETVIINGGVISGNRAVNGGGIYASSGAKFHLNGGEIQDNVATEAGGGVYCSRLYSQNTGRCEFYGGTITGNTAKQGGGAYVGVCYIGYRNCRITGNTATEAGGGLYLFPFASEKIIYMGNVYGGGGTIAPYIYDNTVHSAQNNLYLSDSDTQIVFTARINTDADAKIGVYFTGITKNGASVLLNSLQINSESRAKPYLDRILCDNPDYSQLESRKGDSYYDLFLLNTIPESTVTLDPNGGTLTEGDGSISVKYDTPYGTLPTPKRVNYRFDGWFTEKDGGAKVEETTVVATRENHTLYAHWTFIHEHCICGGDTASGDHTAHTDAVFTAWNGTDTISYTNNVAYVYLKDNATISGNLVVAPGNTLYLCLGGKNYTSNGSNKIIVGDSSKKNKTPAHLILCDCAGGGTIKGATSGWGGGCVYLYNSTLNIFGGKLTGGSVKFGGAVALDDSSCTVNMYGGEISGNKAIGDYKNPSKGGAIFMQKGGVVNVYGGTISGNRAAASKKGSQGGAIFAGNGGSINLFGGTISGNTADNDGGGVYVGSNGTLAISGTNLSGNNAKWGGAVYLAGNASLNMSGGTMAQNNASQQGAGVFLYSGGVKCSLSGGMMEKNTAGVNGGAVYVNDGKLNLSGSPVVTDNTVSGTANNVYLPSGRTLSITGTMADGALVGVTTANKSYPVAFSGAYDANYEAYFASDNASVGAEYNTADKKLYLAVRQYAVTFDVVGSGAATATPANAPAGTEITLTATPAEGHHFSGWIVNRPDVQIYQNKFTMPAGNVAIKAIFEAHSFTEEVAEERYLVTFADCDNDAVYYKSCSCGAAGTETFTKAGTALGHDWGAWTQNSDGATHTRVCSHDARHTETANCSGGTASCVAKAVCAACGGEYGDLIAHDFTAEAAEAKYRQSEANCQSPAIYHKSCSVCGAAGTETFVFGEKDGGNHVGGTEVRGKTAADCVKDGYTGDTFCKGCETKLTSGTEIPAKGHTFGDWTVIRAATIASAGEKARSCGVCGYRETAAIPALSPTPTPTPTPTATPTPTPTPTPTATPTPSVTPTASPSSEPSASASAESGAEAGGETGEKDAVTANAELEPDTGGNTGKRGFGQYLWLWLLLLLLLILLITGRVHYRKYIKKK